MDGIETVGKVQQSDGSFNINVGIKMWLMSHEYTRYRLNLHFLNTLNRLCNI